MNHDALKNEFKKKGFVLFKGLFQEDKISKITNISEKIVEKASSVNIPWPYIRIYRDYPEFNNKKNVFLYKQKVVNEIRNEIDTNLFNIFKKIKSANNLLKLDIEGSEYSIIQGFF